MADETILAAPPVEAATEVVDAEPVAEETDAPVEGAEDTPEGEQPSPEQEDAETPDEPEPKPEELAEFKGSSGARIRELCKQAPGLKELLTKFPKVEQQLQVLARRDAALRDQNITVAELKEYRERLPNGLQDLQTIEQELQELGQIDDAFYNKQGGNLINHMFEADHDAALSLLREMPRQWARLDPDSYNDTFGQIIASTFAKDRIAETALRAYNRAKAKNDTEAMADSADLYNYLQSFGKKAEDDTPQARSLREREERFNREKQESDQSAKESFHKSFVAESTKFQRDLIRANPIFKRLPQGIPEAKVVRMIDLIRNNVIAHLTKSKSFQAQIGPAYKSRDLQKTLEVQRGPQGWQPWIVNMYLRKILDEEMPGIIQGTNAANAKKRQAAQRTGIATRAPARTSTPAKPGDKRKSANDFTMEEIMRGDADHLIKG